MPENRTNVPGSIYLLCWAEDGLVADHAGHYLGWTEGRVEDRTEAHLRGQGNGLVKAAVAEGFNPVVVRTWENVDRHFERKLKNGRNLPRLCSRCKDRRAALKADLRARGLA